MIKKHGGRLPRLVIPRKLAARQPFSPEIFKHLIDRVVDIVWFLKDKITGSRALMIGIASGLLVAMIVMIGMDFYRVKSLTDFQPNTTTKIYDKNGLLVSELFRQKREIVSYNRMPKQLVQAFVAMEDNEFYEHNGINVKGIIRAFFVNISSGSIKQGGSTITQQLAKILLTSRQRNIFRKAKEAVIALMIEVTYPKNKIMELYLNQIFLGHGAYGVESAARFYFNKNVWECNLAECALLATLPSSPNMLSPIRHPKTSMIKHRIALARMVDLGFITIPQAEKAYADFWPDYLDYINELPPSMTTWSSRIDYAPWFTEFIRRKLIADYGEEVVYEEGLAVYTTLDLPKQMAAQRLIEDAMDKQTSISGNLRFKNEDYIGENYSHIIDMFALLNDVPPFARKGSADEKKISDAFASSVLDELEMIGLLAGIENAGVLCSSYRAKSIQDREFQRVQGALVSIDHRNGYIEALVGGSDFSSVNQLNRAMQSRRQPGSTIKPLLYTAAIESRKFTAATAVLDSPIIYLDNEGGDWIPENYDNEFYGLVRLRKALALSINVISIRIADTLGISYIMDYYAKLLRFDKAEAKQRIPRNFSIALGSLEVSPLELTRAYAIIANGGRDVIPFSIRYIKDRKGNIISNPEEDVHRELKKEEDDGTIQIIKPETAQVIISMLETAVSGGTGMSASPGRPAAGKTGTTNNWKDAWFVGFVPQLTTGIWVGYDSAGVSLGIGQAGGGVAAPVWGAYMREAMKNDEVLSFPHYANLESAEVCAQSGLRPSPQCHHVMNEIFIPGTIPDEYCTMCKSGGRTIDSRRAVPRENIAEKQKNAIYKKLENGKKKNTGMDNVGNDLLD